MSDSKRAQVGETMTWVVATIIIVAILVVSIYTASLLGETKKIIPYREYDRENDLIMEKSVFAYFLISDETKKSEIYDWMREQEFHADFEDKFKEVEEVLGR